MDGRFAVQPDFNDAANVIGRFPVDSVFVGEMDIHAANVVREAGKIIAEGGLDPGDPSCIDIRMIVTMDLNDHLSAPAVDFKPDRRAGSSDRGRGLPLIINRRNRQGTTLPPFGEIPTVFSGAGQQT
jgi:hypothetical protein